MGVTSVRTRLREGEAYARSKDGAALVLKDNGNDDRAQVPRPLLSNRSANKVSPAQGYSEVACSDFGTKPKITFPLAPDVIYVPTRNITVLSCEETSVRSEAKVAVCVSACLLGHADDVCRCLGTS